MNTRSLGASGLRVSELSLGTMGFGAEGLFTSIATTDVRQARRLVDVALDAGVNLVDTADVYSAGRSEEVLAAALRGRRERVVLATKVRAPMGDGPNDAGLSRAHIVAACEASLRRLGTDRIDLYQVHGWDGWTPLEETVDALAELVRSGKVRYIGCSNYSAWHLMKALAVADAAGAPRFCAQQIYYSLVAREAEYELVPIAQAEGVGILVYSPLAQGFLAGRASREDPVPAGTRRADLGEAGSIDRERGFDIVDALREIAAAHEATVAQAALRWLLHQAGVSSVIVGARDEGQLRDNLAAATWSMTADELERLEGLSAPAPLYPYWHQQRFAADRFGPFDRWPRRANAPAAWETRG